jgi:predicted nucleic acid-binding protein
VAEQDPHLSGTEHVICDTSFVSVVEASAARPELLAHWPQASRDRLDAAVLAVTVFTIGEVRSGRIRANWGDAKIEKAERALSAYLVVPLDYAVLDSYVSIRARHRQLGDNDMWIAATAKARGWPLVACDLDYCVLKDELDFIYLPRSPESLTACP